jgi:hypothetical protein
MQQASGTYLSKRLPVINERAVHKPSPLYVIPKRHENSNANLPIACSGEALGGEPRGEMANLSQAPSLVFHPAKCYVEAAREDGVVQLHSVLLCPTPDRPRTLPKLVYFRPLPGGTGYQRTQESPRQGSKPNLDSFSASQTKSKPISRSHGTTVDNQYPLKQIPKTS